MKPIKTLLLSALLASSNVACIEKNDDDIHTVVDLTNCKRLMNDWLGRKVYDCNGTVVTGEYKAAPKFGKWEAKNKAAPKFGKRGAKNKSSSKFGKWGAKNKSSSKFGKMGTKNKSSSKFRK